MASNIAIGTAPFGGPIAPAGDEVQSANTFFNPQSVDVESHRFAVDEMPMAIKAFGLVGGEGATTATLHMVTVGYNGQEISEALVINGKTIQLSAENNLIVLDIPGLYRLVLDNPTAVGVVTIVGTRTAISYRSYNLTAFAQSGP